MSNTLKLTVLVDNNTFIDRYFLGEPGVSYFLEVAGARILFDVGYSDIFLHNAARMGLDLLDVDLIVLSHAHLDHTWGLQHLIRLQTDARFEGRNVKRPALVAHPSVFFPRHVPELGEIGCLVTAEKAATFFDLRLSREPLRLAPGLTFLGEINRYHAFEESPPIGRIETPAGEQDDDLRDDSALVFQAADGLVVITGCAHAGICNTLSYAATVCGESRIHDVIGGFHLLDPPRHRLDETVAYFQSRKPQTVHACHCTDLRSKMAISRVASLKEVGVGLELTYPAKIKGDDK